MTKERPSTYTPAPELPSDPDLRRRFGEIVSVLAQTQTVSGAARTLRLSRNHFQTILHRVIAVMVAELTPKPAGRPARPEREVALEAETLRLRRELEALQARSEMIERMMTVVGGIASGKTRLPRSRPPSPTAKKTTGATSRGSRRSTATTSSKPSSVEDPNGEDPEPTTTRAQAVTTMREAQVPPSLCAAALGISVSTVRRDRRRTASTTPRRGRHALDEAACAQVRAVVRATHGAVGAAGLGRMSGLPRRACAQLKRTELRELEYERKARCASVRITAPRIVRGFDAMHVETTVGRAYWLVAADGAVPYRTSIATVPVYDAAHVVAALRADFELHGPPLILRLDRIACQRTPEVDALLARYEVLALHGPPRHPRYYGQLERQNREHRAWSRHVLAASLPELAAAAQDMRTALNALWPRPTLNGRTAEQVWQTRPPLDINRKELSHDVELRAAGLVAAGYETLHARRVAIETALQERGLLSINQGGWC